MANTGLRYKRTIELVRLAHGGTIDAEDSRLDMAATQAFPVPRRVYQDQYDYINNPSLASEAAEWHYAGQACTPEEFVDHLLRYRPDYPGYIYNDMAESISTVPASMNVDIVHFIRSGCKYCKTLYQSNWYGSMWLVSVAAALLSNWRYRPKLQTLVDCYENVAELVLLKFVIGNHPPDYGLPGYVESRDYVTHDARTGFVAPLDAFSLFGVLCAAIKKEKLCMCCFGSMFIAMITWFWDNRDVYRHLQSGYAYFATLVRDNVPHFLNRFRELHMLEQYANESSDARAWLVMNRDSVICHRNRDDLIRSYYAIHYRGHDSSNDFCKKGVWVIGMCSVKYIMDHPFYSSWGVEKKPYYDFGKEEYRPFDFLVAATVFCYYLGRVEYGNQMDALLHRHEWVCRYLGFHASRWLSHCLGIRIVFGSVMDDPGRRVLKVQPIVLVKRAVAENI